MKKPEVYAVGEKGTPFEGITIYKASEPVIIPENEVKTVWKESHEFKQNPLKLKIAFFFAKIKFNIRVLILKYKYRR